MMNEGLLRSFNDMYGLHYVALRYFNVYGPRMDIHGKYTEVLIRWMERLDGGQPPLIFGDGTQTMDFVYVEDVARANILALRRTSSRRGRSTSAPAWKPASTSWPRLLHRSWARGSRPNTARSARSTPCRAVWPRREKAQRLLGFTAPIPLEEGLSQLVRWWRARAGARMSAQP